MACVCFRCSVAASVVLFTAITRAVFAAFLASLSFASLMQRFRGDAVVWSQSLSVLQRPRRQFLAVFEWAPAGDRRRKTVKTHQEVKRAACRQACTPRPCRQSIAAAHLTKAYTQAKVPFTHAKVRSSKRCAVSAVGTHILR